jgi:polar amino acid transport system substrate-binding protein
MNKTENLCLCFNAHHVLVYITKSFKFNRSLLVLNYAAFMVCILLPCFIKAEEVLMAFSKEIPPYIFERNNNGIEIDIISAALAYKGHSLKPQYFSLGRVPYAFTNKLVDAAMGDMGIDLKSKGGFYANPAVIYDNVLLP